MFGPSLLRVTFITAFFLYPSGPELHATPSKLLGSLPGHLLSRFVSSSLAYIRLLSITEINRAAIMKIAVGYFLCNRKDRIRYIRKQNGGTERYLFNFVSSSFLFI